RHSRPRMPSPAHEPFPDRQCEPHVHRLSCPVRCRISRSRRSEGAAVRHINRLPCCCSHPREEGNVELSDYGRIVLRRWRWIALAMVGALAIAVLLTAMTTREYRAQAQLFVSTSASGDASDLVQGGSFTQRQVATYAGIITTRAVLEPVIERLDLGGTPRELAERTVATVPPDTVLINVAVTDPDPER